MPTHHNDLGPDVRRKLRGLSLRQLHYLTQLARKKNFGRAAEALAVSQPTLSQQIKLLEQTLGVALIQRDSRRFGLTEAGADFVACANLVLDALGQGVEAALTHTEERPLRIGLPAFLSYPAITALLARFRAAFPNSPVHFAEMHARELAESLIAGRLDVAFLSLPTPVRFPSEIRHHMVWSGTFELCLSAAHPLAAKAILTSDDCRNIEFILLPRAAHEGHYDRHLAAIQALCPSPRIIHTDVVHALAQIELAAAGVGACLICRDTVNLGPQVALRSTDPPLSTCEVSAFWSSRNLSPLLERFVGVLRTTRAKGVRAEVPQEAT
ncbi:LysR family transcriptional regulator [Tabrizicola sp.]|uniref:LysR family transcriptional regulator n=1 Tax=Tabrizicola sp. TaxID=2005166 RepID=UPI003F2F26D8